VHPLFFGLKRAHHCALRVSRWLLHGTGLTPARFDMLYAIASSGHTVLQSTLGRLLGVTRQTVSRMLASLEQLGLVLRERAHGDRRNRLVRMTKLGALTLADAEEGPSTCGHVIELIQGALSQAPAGPQAEMEGFDTTLRRFRRFFRDRASLVFPWEPDVDEDE
jgi:DNA-binding MarR family transcriptional regulator